MTTNSGQTVCAPVSVRSARPIMSPPDTTSKQNQARKTTTTPVAQIAGPGRSPNGARDSRRMPASGHTVMAAQLSPAATSCRIELPTTGCGLKATRSPKMPPAISRIRPFFAAGHRPRPVIALALATTTRAVVITQRSVEP